MLPLIHLCPSGGAHVPASMLGHDRGPLNISLGYDELCAPVGPWLHGILSEKLTWSILMPQKSHRNHAPTSIGVWRFSGLQDTIFRTHWCGLMDRESVSEQSRQAQWWQRRGVADGGARLGVGRLFRPLCNFADFNSCTSLRISDASLRINSLRCYPFKGGFSKYATSDLTQFLNMT